jgi:hypothetical protein
MLRLLVKSIIIKTTGGLKAMPEKLRWDGTIKLGDVLRIGSIIVVIALAWGQFDKRATVLELQIKTIADQQAALVSRIEESNARTERVERYLISRDPAYDHTREAK